jgi:hypothetical protein
MACLFEQARRYAVELLEDAEQYAVGNEDEYPVITKNDLLLAVELRDGYRVGNTHSTVGMSMSHQLPKLNIVAQQVNRIPLPPIPSYCYSGVVLPLDPNYALENGNTNNTTGFDNATTDNNKSQLLTARTYDIVSATQVAQKMIQPFPQSPAALYQQQQQQIAAAAAAAAVTTTSLNANSNHGGPGGSNPNASTRQRPTNKKAKTTDAPGYGASRGRQIPIQLKSTSTTTGADTPSKSTSSAATGGGGGVVPMDISSPTSGKPSSSSSNTPSSTTKGPSSTTKK